MKYVLLFALSQLADLGSTAFAIAHGATEMNPLALFLLDHGGFNALIAFKMAVVNYAFLLVVYLGHPKLKFWLIGLSVVGFLIATWNMMQWI